MRLVISDGPGRHHGCIVTLPDGVPEPIGTALVGEPTAGRSDGAAGDWGGNLQNSRAVHLTWRRGWGIMLSAAREKGDASASKRGRRHAVLEKKREGRAITITRTRTRTTGEERQVWRSCPGEVTKGGACVKSSHTAQSRKDWAIMRRIGDPRAQALKRLAGWPQIANPEQIRARKSELASKKKGRLRRMVTPGACVLAQGTVQFLGGPGPREGVASQEDWPTNHTNHTNEETLKSERG